MSETEYVAWWSQEDAYEIHGAILEETEHESVMGDRGQFIVFDSVEDAEYAEGHGIKVSYGTPAEADQPASAHPMW